MARRRDEYFVDKVCVRCGSDQDLRLDHIDPEQKVSHKIWSWSAARREEELAKCQVLCEPCHQEKTAEDMGYQPLEHGTTRMYKRCKCDLCRAANAIVKARQREARLAAGGNR